LTVGELPELTVEAGTTSQFGSGPLLGSEEMVIVTVRACSNTVLGTFTLVDSRKLPATFPCGAALPGKPSSQPDGR
jgi:hypothetical protein